MKHHFVPQLLLDYWDCGKKEGKEKINIFDIKKLEIRLNQTIKEVFFEHDLYGKNSPVENPILADLVEGPTAAVVKKIVTGNFHITSKDLSILHTFIWSLYNRTPAFSKKSNEWADTAYKAIVQAGLNLKGLNPAEASSVEFNFKDDNFLAENILNELSWGKILLEDLEYHIIKNETSSEFYI